jgi:hypothetical protein
MKFGCSLRTIERLWKDRAAYKGDAALPEVTMDERLLALQNRITNQNVPSPGRLMVRLFRNQLEMMWLWLS